MANREVTEKLSDLFKVTQLLSHEARIWAQEVQFQNPSQNSVSTALFLSHHSFTLFITTMPDWDVLPYEMLSLVYDSSWSNFISRLALVFWLDCEHGGWMVRWQWERLQFNFTFSFKSITLLLLFYKVEVNHSAYLEGSLWGLKGTIPVNYLNMCGT